MFQHQNLPSFCHLKLHVNLIFYKCKTSFLKSFFPFKETISFNIIFHKAARLEIYYRTWWNSRVDFSISVSRSIRTLRFKLWSIMNWIELVMNYHYQMNIITYEFETNKCYLRNYLFQCFMRQKKSNHFGFLSAIRNEWFICLSIQYFTIILISVCHFDIFSEIKIFRWRYHLVNHKIFFKFQYSTLNLWSWFAESSMNKNGQLDDNYDH